MLHQQTAKEVLRTSCQDEDKMCELHAVMNSSFIAVKKEQISGHRGEKMKILNINGGYAQVEMSDGNKGYIPTYFLDLNDIPGQNFAQQIRYRRRWYHLVDQNESVLYEDNPTNLLNNISHLSKIVSFLPVDKKLYSSIFLNIHKRPVCIESLQDLKVKLGENIVLACKFFSEEPHTIVWRGPVIAAKRNYNISTNVDGYSILSWKNCLKDDTGQYWAEAENIFGKCHTVSWVTVITAPGKPDFTAHKIINQKSVWLQWNEPNMGNSKEIYYVVEYKQRERDDYKVAIKGITGTSAVITDLNPGFYSFRLYAFNEFFKGKPASPINVLLNSTISQSLSLLSFIADQNNKEKYMDRSKFQQTYTISQIKSKGRFANILEVVNKNDGKKYAAKIFCNDSTLKYDNEKNIEREICLMRCIQHYSFPTFHESFKIADHAVIIMQWLNGPHLLDYIVELGYISEALIQRFCKDLLRALEYIHSYMIPENLLTHISNEVRLVLIDFRSACYDTTKAVVCNDDTIEFSSPEYISHREITTKADIWSFGILLHTLIAGHTPFEDDCEEMMRLKILSNTPLTSEKQNYQIYSLDIISLLKSVITDNARSRLSATDCLQSQWMQSKASQELFLVDYLEDFNEQYKGRIRKAKNKLSDN
ncbi:unnamed protein product [Thelazia callipaeda]|uniref:Protein kinase domain-containing protein n=1 Tax=Thelazia callipaeda TaxID=103827 RepID=A0A0N5CYT0_THECL|nr:unnamed protein product [Thelazia callipaeda]